MRTWILVLGLLGPSSCLWLLPGPLFTELDTFTFRLDAPVASKTKTWDITPKQTTMTTPSPTTPTNDRRSPPMTRPPPEPSCGVEGDVATTRIVGGVPSKSGKYPWMVTLRIEDEYGGNKHQCGGTLVKPNWVLTAAHCVMGDPLGNLMGIGMWNLFVVLGEYDLGAANVKENPNRLAMNPIIHPYYNRRNHSIDVALLKLKHSVNLMPACLPDKDNYIGQIGTVAGWGTTNSCPPDGPVVLREVDLSIVSDEECEAASSANVTFYDGAKCVHGPASYKGRISNDMLCAGSLWGDNVGKHTASGDSGGPLTVKENGRHILVGVVSWGDGFQEDGLFDVFAEVSKQIKWINMEMARNKDVMM